MKKLIALLLVTAMAISLTACGETQEPADSGSFSGYVEATAYAESTAPVVVDEGLIFVDVTLSAALFGEMTEEEIISAAEEAGYTNCKVNEDGTVTYTMTKVKQRQLLEEYKTSIDEMIAGYLEGENKVASFVDIVCNEDYSQVDITVDPEAYSVWDSMYAITFYMTGIYYQSFAGMDAEDIDVVVNFIDSQTQEILETASYRSFMENQASE